MKLNDEKTEFIIVGSKDNLSKVTTDQIKVGKHIIKSTKSVRNLGAYFDSELSMETHVIKTAKSAWYLLNSIG